jgi:hypothetical protein
MVFIFHFFVGISYMRTNIVYLIIGFIVGYLLMITTSVHYHAMNSKKVKNTYFVYDDKKVRYKPKIIGKI